MRAGPVNRGFVIVGARSIATANRSTCTAIYEAEMSNRKRCDTERRVRTWQPQQSEVTTGS